MSKAVAGAALLGADIGMAVLLSTVTLGAAAVPMAEVFNALAGPLLAGGISMEAAAIAGALTSNRGMEITTRQAAAYRQVIYGQQRVGGVTIYESTTGSSHDQYNYVIVLSGHEIDSIQNLYLDGRQVHWQGSGPGWSVRNGVGFGGIADSNTYTGPDGQQYNFGGTGHSGIYAEARYGDQLPGDVIGGLTANDPNWAADGSGNSPFVGGCAYIYLKIEYNPTLFPSAPEIRVTINGKNDILDPRTGTTGFTSNWALICADVLSDTTFGLGDPSVNQAQLIAAANVCDEQVEVAALSTGGTVVTESRYATNWHYDTAVGPGDVLATMMPGAQGRLSRIGGEWYIWPAYWQGPSFTFDENALTAPLQWTPYRSTRDLFNRVNGTYIAPTYPFNVAGNLYDQNGFYDGLIQNNFPFAFQPTNYPQYAADVLHGFASDQYLAADGGRQLPKEIVFQTVLSVTQAQRCAAIALKRNRQQGSGTLEMSLPAYSMQPADVMQFTFSQMGWTEKALEIVGTSFKCEADESSDGEKALSTRVSANVIETDPSVYEYSPAEELTVYDVPATPTQQSRTPAPPTNMSLTCSAATALTDPITGIVTPRIEVQWDTPLDVLTTGIQVQYQLDPAGTPTGPWIDAGVADVSLNLFYIGNLVNGGEYNVRIRSVRPSGATSVWEEINGFIVSLTLTVATQLALAPGTLIGEAYAPLAFTGDTSTGSATITSVSTTLGLLVGQAITGTGIPSGTTITAIGSGTITLSATPTATASSVALTGAGTALILPLSSGTFTTVIGNTTVTVSPANYPLGVLNQGQLYWVYYVDPTLVGGAVTAVATQNSADFLNKPGYFLIDSVVTPVNAGSGGGGGGGGSRYSPSTFADVGSRTTASPEAAFDGDVTSAAQLSASYNGYAPSGSTGQCIWQGFPSIITSTALTLNVIAQVSVGSTGIPCNIHVSGLGGGGGILSTSSDAATATYTLTVPSGTALNTVAVIGTVDASSLGGGGGAGIHNGSMFVAEIWIA